MSFDSKTGDTAAQHEARPNIRLDAGDRLVQVMTEIAVCKIELKAELKSEIDKM